MVETGNRIVWGRANSSNVMKVLWGLAELGLPFERFDVGGAFGKTDTLEYRAMNPTGLVPTLQEGDFPYGKATPFCATSHKHTPRTPRSGRPTHDAGQQSTIGWTRSKPC